MNEEQHQQLKYELGQAVMAVQNKFVSKLSPAEVMPELVHSLVSLGAFVLRNNCHGDVYKWRELCLLVEEIEWPLRRVGLQ